MSRSELNRIIQGDALESLKLLSAESVDCCITSPPYYSLRDYGIDGQIGLEQTPDEYVTKLVTVFREVKRVLKPEGTCWLNLGDSYANAKGGFRAGRNAVVGNTKAGEQRGLTEIPNGYKIKDLLGIPWMVAFALRADGWYLRSDIIWHKPNCMPESVTDRPTRCHEYIFLLSKSKKYYYDAEAIKEDSICPIRSREANNGEDAVMRKTRGYDNHLGTYPTRNKRTVWTIATKPFPGSHFAVFPEKLIEPCVLAGTSERGYCPECGKPWARQVEKGEMVSRPDNGNTRPPMLTAVLAGQGTNGTGKSSLAMMRSVTTTGWLPSCSCGLAPAPGVVLDPFFGAGTTGLVAKKLGRSFIGIELNPEYVDLARKRIASAHPPLSSFVAGVV